MYDILAAVGVDYINKQLLSLLPPLWPAQDVGDVDEGQHDPLLPHLRLLGDTKVVGAAYAQAGQPQEAKEEEDDLGDDILPAAILRQILVEAPGQLMLDDGQQVPVAVEMEGGGDCGEGEDDGVQDPHHSRIQIV